MKAFSKKNCWSTVDNLRRGLKVLAPFYWNLATPPRCRFAQCDLSLWQALVQEKQVDNTPAFSPEFCKCTEQMEISGMCCSGRICFQEEFFLLYFGVQHELNCTAAWVLPAKEVVPLERIHLLEFRFLQQAVTQSWVYVHITAKRIYQNELHLVNWANLDNMGSGCQSNTGHPHVSTVHGCGVKEVSLLDALKRLKKGVSDSGIAANKNICKGIGSNSAFVCSQTERVQKEEIHDHSIPCFSLPSFFCLSSY